jgi:nucleoside phosphorylase
MPLTPSPVLLVAALHAEVAPIRLRMAQRRRLEPRLTTGWLADTPVVLLRCGVGRRAARCHSERAIQLLAPRAVLSFGTCGALVDDLRVGEVVWGQALLGSSGSEPLPVLEGFRGVMMVTVPRVVDDAESRAAWARQGAQVCEMEADGVREAAVTARLPFHAAKVVSDMAGARRPGGYRRPRSLRLAHFQLRAARLVHRELAPAIEAWLAAGNF